MSEEAMFHSIVPDGAPGEEVPQKDEKSRDGGEYFND